MSDPVRIPVPGSEIRSELSERTRIREFRGIEIHVFTAHEAPATMQEIGRIRELEFRAEGGGTGKEADIDAFDTDDPAFAQLVAWDPSSEELIGMYRVAHLSRLITSDGTISSPSARLFQFSPAFVRDYAPFTVELGRSVVNRSAKRAVMGLFCVWAGLGAIVCERPDVRYFFGKVTTYPNADAAVLSVIHSFLDNHCRGPEDLMRPLADAAVTLPHPGSISFDCRTHAGAVNHLKEVVRDLGGTLPPLLISYLELSETLMAFGTARNDSFGSVYETAIMVTIADIHSRQRKRFVESYASEKPGALKI